MSHFSLGFAAKICSLLDRCHHPQHQPPPGPFSRQIRIYSREIFETRHPSRGFHPGLIQTRSLANSKNHGARMTVADSRVLFWMKVL